MKVLGKGIIGLLMLFGITSCSLINKGCTQGERILDKTIDADNVIYNYEYFKRQYHEILAQERKVVNAVNDYESFVSLLPKDRSQMDYSDKSRIAILQSNISGAKNVYYNMISEYNARAKMLNRSIFMGKDVPQEIFPQTF